MSLNAKPDELMNSLLGKLYDSLASGDETLEKSKDNYLAWCTPGIPYDPEDFNFIKEGFRGFEKKTELNRELKSKASEQSDIETDGKSASDKERERMEDAYGKLNAAEAFARLADFIPNTSNIHAGQGTRNVWNAENILSQVYEEVLRFSQVPNDEPDEATKAKIEKLRGLLTQTVKVKEFNDVADEVEVEKTIQSPMVTKYFEKMTAYNDAAREYNSKMIAALTSTNQADLHDWSRNRNIYENKVKAAMNDWISNGHKTKYDRINAFIHQVEGKSMMLLKERYLDDFHKSKITSVNSGLEFMYATLVPAGFVKEGGWTRFTFTENDMKSDYSSTNQSFSGGGGLNLGFYKIKGKAGYEEEEIETTMKMTNFKLEFEICQVQIVRPWLSLNFLKNPYWRFPKDSSTHADILLSDGKMPPNGRAPVITTACIFIRNLKMNFENSESYYKKMKEKVEGGLSAGYGLFSLGGGYTRADGKGDSKFSYDHQGISIEGMQLIGFKCHILPKTPNANPSIDNWA